MQEINVESVVGEVAVMPIGAPSSLMYYGTVGGGGGIEFREPLETGHITNVQVNYRKWIDAFLFNATGGRKFRFGGTGGDRAKAFGLAASQYIFGITVRYGSYIDFIRFHVYDVNTKLYTTVDMGNPGGGSASYELIFRPTVSGAPPPKEICGFGGRAKVYLDAIGVYARDR